MGAPADPSTSAGRCTEDNGQLGKRVSDKHTEHIHKVMEGWGREQGGRGNRAGSMDNV